MSCTWFQAWKHFHYTLYSLLPAGICRLYRLQSSLPKPYNYKICERKWKEQPAKLAWRVVPCNGSSDRFTDRISLVMRDNDCALSETAKPNKSINQFQPLLKSICVEQAWTIIPLPLKLCTFQYHLHLIYVENEQKFTFQQPDSVCVISVTMFVSLALANQVHCWWQRVAKNACFHRMLTRKYI
jgi:hypothetical protein